MMDTAKALNIGAVVGIVAAALSMLLSITYWYLAHPIIY